MQDEEWEIGRNQKLRGILVLALVVNAEERSARHTNTIKHTKELWENNLALPVTPFRPQGSVLTKTHPLF